jgi:hypothetical protein
MLQTSSTEMKNPPVPALALLTFTLLLGGCALFGTSKTERVMRFETDLNENRQFAYQNFLESATTDYSLLANSDPVATWDQWFPPAEYPDDTLYTFTVEDTTSDSVTATVTGPAEFTGNTLVFGMVRDGLYWYIERLTLDGTVIVD